MKKSSISKKQLREFGFLIGFGFPLIVGFIIPAIYGHLFRIWTLWLGILFLVLGFIVPRTLFYPYKIWMLIGKVLGWFNSKLILGFIFIFILQPIAFLMRLFGYDPLRIRKKNLKSYKEIRKDRSIDLKSIF